MLAPFIRIYQWSGLSPFSLFANNCKSIWRYESFRFVAITLVNLLINITACIYILVRFDYHGGLGSLINLLMTLNVFTHAFAVLIESCSKRSIQSKLLTTFDEIEKILAEKLDHRMNERQLRLRFLKFTIIWIVKNAVITFASILGVFAAQQYENVYYGIATFLPFYTSTLSYAQWLAYVDVIRYNIERTNDCLLKMGEANRIDWLEPEGQIFCIKPVATDAFDTCKRLIDLRKCFNKIWLASTLINRCFHWSLIIGSGNEMCLFVINLYWMLVSLTDNMSSSWPDVAFCAIWAGMILSNFLAISMICEDINIEVSMFTHRFRYTNLIFEKIKFQTRRTLFLVHRISAGETHCTCERLRMMVSSS